VFLPSDNCLSITSQANCASENVVQVKLLRQYGQLLSRRKKEEMGHILVFEKVACRACAFFRPGYASQSPSHQVASADELGKVKPIPLRPGGWG
jgi:hypothetical protein